MFMLVGVSTTPALAGPVDVVAMEECRFLSFGSMASDKREEVEPQQFENLDLFLGLMRKTRLGMLVDEELKKFHREGIGSNPAKRLRYFLVHRDRAGPSAEYYETGEMHFDARFRKDLELLEAEGKERREALSRLYTTASFVVHEGIHAISHHLHLLGRFPNYKANTKVNEALAYYVQGLYIRELEEQGIAFAEERRIPTWDMCTARIVKILNGYGITAETSLERAYDQFAEWELDANSATASKLQRLWRYFEFIHNSAEAPILWKLEEESIPKLRVVKMITDMIWRDVEERNCDFTHTFALMKNRIILYSHYEDTPPGISPCQYFKDFVNGLRGEQEAKELLGAEIETWLRKRKP